jgi:hypothetical protein
VSQPLKLPILSGIYADSVADFVESYPVNREPVVLNTGLSEGYLRVAPGIAGIGTGPGVDRGGINWDGVCYRVMGTRLVSVSSGGVVTDLGDVGSGGQCSLDYSFDNLIIASGTKLYYWNPSDGLRQVTDPDLGIVLDAIWIDGYTMTTDGTSLVVTELNDPMAVDPLKYGSSEEDPDPVEGLFRIRGEVYALNRNTIEVFNDIGGSGFPFQRNSGAQIPYGCVGTHAKALYIQTFAFVGSARNENLAVYLAGAGDAQKLSTRRIDKMLAALTDAEAAAITMESRVDDDEQRLLVHLPTATLVFFNTASRKAEQKVWAIYASGVEADEAYRGRNGVLAYGKWIVGDNAGNIGVIDPDVPTHFGAVTGWRFDTALLFNENGRGIVNSLTLTGLPGRALPGADPRIFLSFTIDGVTYGQEYAIASGVLGQRNKIMQWRKPRRFDSWIGQRFRAADNGMAAFARLDAMIEPLAA